MPLKFIGNDNKNKCKMSLAVIYTLRNENAIILQTCRGKQERYCNNLKQKRLQRSHVFSNFTETELMSSNNNNNDNNKDESNKENKFIKDITHLQLPQLLYTPSNNINGHSILNAKTSSDLFISSSNTIIETTKKEKDISQIPLFHLTKNKFTELQQIMFPLPINEFPLPLLLKLTHTPQFASKYRRELQLLLQHIFLNSNIKETWGNLLNIFKSAWISTVNDIKVSLPLLQFPSLSPFVLLFSNIFTSSPQEEQEKQKQEEEEENILNITQNNYSNLIDSTIIPFRKSRGRILIKYKIQKETNNYLQLKELWSSLSVSTQIEWNSYSKQLLLLQEENLMHYFKSITNSLQKSMNNNNNNILPFPEIILNVTSLIPMIFNNNNNNNNQNTKESLELPHIIIPYFTHRERNKMEQRCYSNKTIINNRCISNIRTELINTIKDSLFNYLSLPKCMKHATEIRFPDGKHIRQTLTLRNTPKENLEELMKKRKRNSHNNNIYNNNNNIYNNNNSRFPYITEWWMNTGKSPKIYSQQLAASFLSFKKELLTSVQFELPKRREKRKRENKILNPPSLITWLKQGSITFNPLSWLPLALESEEENNNNNNNNKIISHSNNNDFADIMICPDRLFPRDIELKSFMKLRERKVNVRNDVEVQNEDIIIENNNNNKEEEEKLYNEAFLYDTQTIPFPYCENIALIEDAKMHYCYRLALSRERRRLSLDTSH